MARDLFDELSAAEMLPSPPGIALEIIRLNQSENIDIHELTQVVGRDPAIVAKLIRLANSATSSRQSQVADIRQAIMTLGLRSVNLLALSFSFAAVRVGDENSRFDYTHYWTCAAVTTASAQLLADRHAPEIRDEAFLAGLLCDFAQLVLAECAPKRYRAVLRKLARASRPVQEIEAELLGCDHAALGQRLLEEWGLPDVVSRAVGVHHDPAALVDADAATASLARVLHVATACGELYAGGDVHRGVEQICESASRHFGMTPAGCREFIDDVFNQVGELISLLSLETTDSVALAEIRVAASEHLVRESLALNEQMRVVSDDVARLAREKNEIEERATLDRLTGLRNRGYFDDALEQAVARARQHGTPVSLLLLDIDHFKQANDEYGHTAGDRFLEAVGRVLCEHLRPGETAARYGGEELAFICADASLEQLHERADLLRGAIADIAVETARGRLQRTVSIGGCLVSHIEVVQSSIDIVDAADAELYRAKADGRDRVCTAVLAEG